MGCSDTLHSVCLSGVPPGSAVRRRPVAVGIGLADPEVFVDVKRGISHDVRHEAPDARPRRLRALEGLALARQLEVLDGLVGQPDRAQDGVLQRRPLSSACHCSDNGFNLKMLACIG